MFDYADLGDLELQKRAAEGDLSAEEALVVRYLPLVGTCARSLKLFGGEGKDLFQEGVFGLISAVRSYDPSHGASFHTYAEHCIRMRLLSAIKSASRLKHFPLNDGISLEELSEDPGADISNLPELVRHSPEELILAKESREELYEAFSRCLSSFEIKVLDLYLEGLSYREIADRLCRNAKSIDNAVQRIRQKLAREHLFGDISRC